MFECLYQIPLHFLSKSDHSRAAYSAVLEASGCHPSHVCGFMFSIRKRTGKGGQGF